ncbi:hypothetical protein N4T77_19995 [Clostridium sp. CX1]|uniref:hypothetical protein n=1 Tax=Clostridium sp. CX1 TaxID=2978346 RepID=UPI0021BF0DBE|nr:hypothetical protein [Clostridium sp. CX1]MCT8978863.1 hypothetical protein [Clostridium sp. CX1]
MDILRAHGIGAGKKDTTYGDGSDGVFNSSGNITFAVPTQDVSTIVKQYSSFTLNAGHTLTVDKRCRGLVIYCTGDVVINGLINMDHKSAVVNPFTLGRYVVALGINSKYEVPLGGAGGNGGELYYTASGGKGYGYGYPFGGTGGGGGAGGSITGNNNSAKGASGGNIPTDSSALGGSGSQGAGGNGGGSPSIYSIGVGGSSLLGSGGGGGGSIIDTFGGVTSKAEDGQPGTSFGGGAVIIIAKSNITIGNLGSIYCRGGAGGAGGGSRCTSGSSAYTSYGGCGGGGAGGGVIALYYHVAYSNSGTLNVSGGSGGSGGYGARYDTPNGANWTYAGASGQSGATGSILIQKV